MAQPGSARRSGRRGPRFKSGRPDVCGVCALGVFLARNDETAPTSGRRRSLGLQRLSQDLGLLSRELLVGEDSLVLERRQLLELVDLRGLRWRRRLLVLRRGWRVLGLRVLGLPVLLRWR